ncbi:hypothetical protein PROPEN_01709 [Proteus penneri ATCC 35198]|nr:hypothetical protein PROPEN_01709 [Proteus penneri ATCC 35198]
MLSYNPSTYNDLYQYKKMLITLSKKIIIKQMVTFFDKYHFSGKRNIN